MIQQLLAIYGEVIIRITEDSIQFIDPTTVKCDLLP